MVEVVGVAVAAATVAVSVAVEVKVGVMVGVPVGVAECVSVGKIITTGVSEGAAVARGVRVMLTFGTHRL